mgnify:CR=1 FL=1
MYRPSVPPELWAEFILRHRWDNREQISWMGEKENYSLETLKKQQQMLLEDKE